MDIQEKTRKEEKSIHPFFFLCILSVFALIIAFFWHLWQEEMENAQLQDVVRSEDIDLLLNNSSALSVIFQAQQSDIVEQVLQLESEIKEVYSQKTQYSVEEEFNNFTSQNTLDPVQLALRSIIILQGENGLESWRLKAQWATLRQESSLLSMYMPKLLYTPQEKGGKEKESQEKKDKEKREKEENDFQVPVNLLSLIDKPEQDKPRNACMHENFEIHTPDMVSIQSNRGIVIENSKIFLKDNVFAKQNLNSIHGDALNYDDNTKIATFPSLSHIQSENLVGQANSFDWHLEENLIYGSGDVVMEWTPKTK